ncbi:CHAP domain-containing protein [Rhizobium leguminosarum]|uniref:CHAP domain-containing protein n=1 Tax=Rhizobium leguminosarum TaxID=384 RepID=UPI001A91E1B5|nr:CHAP domain-containing protein [Rhizobium leguminosarum]MBY5554149.1 CHAP domain-containing protein [Rhizobium leguminosarum]MBY5728591.1 CHAP domain-containing protein [Rhizobium leguminosarum]QSW27269.1 CHAP domain-containing protein [Rhizobium leguminosarum]
MDRRAFLLTGGIWLAASKAGFSQQSNETVIQGEVPPLPDDLIGKAAAPPAPYIETKVVGTARPKSEEIEAAYYVLTESPFDCAPVEVAEYVLAVGSGAYGPNLRKFAREWPERANPLIFHFFSATQTKPEGDVTAWCAAFLNWCILRAHAKKQEQIGKSPGFFSTSGLPFSVDDMKAHSTNSASSGSFRCWQETKNPKRGDLVVFKNKGTDQATKYCLGQGHVAFYLRTPGANLVQVLGGNQISAGSGGAVTVANMSTTPESRFMKYALLK